MDKYRNAPQERLMRLIMVMSSNTINGVAPGQLAALVGTTASNISRDLRVMQSLGFAEPVAETGRWRLGRKLVQIGVNFASEINRARARLDELETNFTRRPH